MNQLTKTRRAFGFALAALFSAAALGAVVPEASAQTRKPAIVPNPPPPPPPPPPAPTPTPTPAPTK